MLSDCELPHLGATTAAANDEDLPWALELLRMRRYYHERKCCCEWEIRARLLEHRPSWALLCCQRWANAAAGAVAAANEDIYMEYCHGISVYPVDCLEVLKLISAPNFATSIRSDDMRINYILLEELPTSIFMIQLRKLVKSFQELPCDSMSTKSILLTALQSPKESS